MSDSAVGIKVDATNAAEVAKKVKAGELPGPARSLAEAVCRVMEQVGYVQKDKQMQGGGSYRYVSVEAVIDALRPEMIRQQLILLPADVSALTLEDFENRNGTRQNRTQVKYTFRLIHAPTGQSEPVAVIGEAIDVGDKSSNKAMTAARKYALIMAFNIETGLDPDDTPSREQERAAKAQPAAAPRQTAAPQQPHRTANNNHLRAQVAAAIGAARSRDDLGGIWKSFEADRDAGRFSEEDAESITAMLKEAAARFPKPAATGK